MDDLKIENVIASMDFEMDIDLAKIANAIKDTEYDPDHFPGLIYKLKSPKTITLIFSKGYTVCTGAKSIQNAKAVLTIIFKKLTDLKLITVDKIPVISIQNLIVSYKYKTPLNLLSVSDKLPGGNTEYNPGKFPGVVYKDKNKDISVLIFPSGTIVGYGSPHYNDLENILGSLEQYYS